MDELTSVTLQNDDSDFSYFLFIFVLRKDTAKMFNGFINCFMHGINSLLLRIYPVLYTLPKYSYCHGQWYTCVIYIHIYTYITCNHRYNWWLRTGQLLLLYTQPMYTSEMMPQYFFRNMVSKVVLALWVNINKTTARYRKYNSLSYLQESMLKAILHFTNDIVIKSVYHHLQIW